MAVDNAYMYIPVCIHTEQKKRLDKRQRVAHLTLCTNTAQKNTTKRTQIDRKTCLVVDRGKESSVANVAHLQTVVGAAAVVAQSSPRSKNIGRVGATRMLTYTLQVAQVDASSNAVIAYERDVRLHADDSVRRTLDAALLFFPVVLHSRMSYTIHKQQNVTTYRRLLSSLVAHLAHLLQSYGRACRACCAR